MDAQSLLLMAMRHFNPHISLLYGFKSSVCLRSIKHRDANGIKIR